jgi:diguanylate cyclase (GGDEF)-like protein
MTEIIKLLLVEDNPSDARLAREALAGAHHMSVQLSRADSVSQALEMAVKEHPDLILLDLDLPDSRGYDTFARVHAALPDIPVVVLTGHDDEDFALRIVQHGAQDYLFKRELEGHTLARVMRHALERHKMLQELRALSLSDELTGLYNRRGFFHLATRQLLIASRMSKKIALIYCDMDNLKQINDKLGHEEGSRAIKDLAGVLTNSVRDSDIVARLGGDEFAILLVESDVAFMEAVGKRIQSNIDAFNLTLSRPYKLAASLGLAACEPGKPVDIDKLLSMADKLMYADKRKRKGLPS